MKNPVMIDDQMAETIVISLIVAQHESQIDDERIADVVDALLQTYPKLANSYPSFIRGLLDGRRML